MANPRIDDLRKKLDKEPGSRLFAQLAEELRKDGELAEAIRVSRQGLSQHPNYPSARMTLGRALLDSGDLASARKEFESVLKGAADNILASRFLAECLEGLGDTAEALARYKATLALAPGDKQVQARIQSLEKAASATAAATPLRPAEPAAAVPAAVEEPEPPPIRLVEVNEPMELVTRYEEAAPAPPAPAEDIFFDEPEPAAAPAVAPEPAERPVPLVPVDEEFELERSYEAPPVPSRAEPEPAPEPLVMYEAPGEPVVEADATEPEPVVPEPVEREPLVVEAAPEPIESAAAAGEPVPSSEPLMVEPEVIDEEFEVEAPAPPPGRPRVTFRDILVEAGVTREEFEAGRAGGPSPPVPPAPSVEPPAAAPATSPSAEPELASPTLAELYFRQGFPDKAIEVYRRLLEREPASERLRTRMEEIESEARAVPAGPAGSREEAIGRVIARLQDLRAALARRE